MQGRKFLIVKLILKVISSQLVKMILLRNLPKVICSK